MVFLIGIAAAAAGAVLAFWLTRSARRSVSSPNERAALAAELAAAKRDNEWLYGSDRAANVQPSARCATRSSRWRPMR